MKVRPVRPWTTRVRWPPAAAPVGRRCASRLTHHRWVIPLLAAIGGLAGMAAAGGVLGRAPEVNILVAFGTLVGIQSVALLVWIVFALRPRRPAAGGGLPGLALRGLLRRWSARRDAGTRDAALAWLDLHAGGRLGFWTLSGLSHLFWLTFTAAALAALTWWLSVRQYDFVWGTTILDETTVLAAVDVLGRLPAAAGFTVPDAELIRGSRTGVTEPAGRVAWSGDMRRFADDRALQGRLLGLDPAGE